MNGGILIMIFFAVGIMIALAFSLLAIVLHEYNDEQTRWSRRH
jgi:hypothetical protein